MGSRRGLSAWGLAVVSVVLSIVTALVVFGGNGLGFPRWVVLAVWSYVLGAPVVAGLLRLREWALGRRAPTREERILREFRAIEDRTLARLLADVDERTGGDDGSRTQKGPDRSP